MNKRRLLSLPLVAFASLSNTAADTAERNEPKLCTMPLPRTEILESFKGPVSGPFILAAKDGRTIAQRSITLLSMNIQNIPFAERQNPFYREDRKDCLKRLSEKFDAVAFQEDFIRRPLNANSLWKPRFPRPYLFKTGLPGLSFASTLPYRRVASGAFSRCSGFLDRNNDCLASKGYQVTKVEDVTVVNTHLDAGAAREDRGARITQLQELAAALPQQGPLLVVGDFNLHLNSREDEAALKEFLARTGLRVHARYSAEKGHDFIMGRDIDVNWTGKVEDPLLSDHAGLIVNLAPQEAPRTVLAVK